MLLRSPIRKEALNPEILRIYQSSSVKIYRDKMSNPIGQIDISLV
jgi:hypothetical protein